MPQQQWTRKEKAVDVVTRVGVWVFFVIPLIAVGLAATWFLYLKPLFVGRY